MVQAEPTNNRTADSAGIDTNHSTMLTLLRELNVICEQRWIQFKWQNNPRRFCIWWQNTLPFSKPV